MKRLFRTLKCYRTFELTIAGQTVHAASPVPAEIYDLIAKLNPEDLPRQIGSSRDTTSHRDSPGRSAMGGSPGRTVREGRGMSKRCRSTSASSYPR